MSAGLKQRSGSPQGLPPEFEGVDWGIIDQRLAARRRRIGRIAVRIEFAILCFGALSLVSTLPVVAKNLALVFGSGAHTQMEGKHHG